MLTKTAFIIVGIAIFLLILIGVFSNLNTSKESFRSRRRRRFKRRQIPYIKRIKKSLHRIPYFKLLGEIRQIKQKQEQLINNQNKMSDNQQYNNDILSNINSTLHEPLTGLLQDTAADITS